MTGCILFRLTKYGVGAPSNDLDDASNFPIYECILNDEEIIAVLNDTKSTCPEEIRACHSEMEDRP